jgi:SAM-dependent methyltransferase
MPSTNSTVEAYNRYAELYDQEVIDFWSNFPNDFLEQFAQHLPGTRILDVGSGSGRDALLLQQMGLEVICQDGSTSMIDITTKLGFESHLVDFSDMDFGHASFDGVWAYTSLIHIPQDEARAVIKQLRNSLKPDGVFAIGVIEGNDASMVERKTMPGVSRYFKNYSSHELAELIEPLGFTLLYESSYQPHHKVYLNQLYKITD